MRGLLSIMLLPALLLTACDTQTPPPAASIRVDEAMGGSPDPGFARAFEPREFHFPRDHGPHPAFATEWWYLTGNLDAQDGRRFGYQLTLFRVGLRPGEAAQDSDWRSNQVYMGHLAISDIAGGRHYSAERFARAAADLAGAHVQPFAVWLGPWKLHSESDFFPLELEAQAGDFGLTLQLHNCDKPMVLQGERGLSRKSATPGNASYYYSCTRLPTTGEVRIGRHSSGVEGDSWLDREWSSSALDSDQAGWDWFALQLDDGRELMFYQLRTREGEMHAFSRGVLVEQDGNVRSLLPDEVRLTPLRDWEAGDGTRYPVAWRLEVPGFGLDLEVEAVLDDQLMDHRVQYWEGAVDVSGSHAGRGYLELSGYAGDPETP
ncbi:MAG: lipocalin-like domain-containing protein [Gammaproteobacteria bacterium]